MLTFMVKAANSTENSFHTISGQLLSVLFTVHSKLLTQLNSKDTIPYTHPFEQNTQVIHYVNDNHFIGSISG